MSILDLLEADAAGALCSPDSLGPQPCPSGPHLTAKQPVAGPAWGALHDSLLGLGLLARLGLFELAARLALGLARLLPPPPLRLPLRPLLVQRLARPSKLESSSPGAFVLCLLDLSSFLRDACLLPARRQARRRTECSDALPALARGMSRFRTRLVRTTSRYLLADFQSWPYINDTYKLQLNETFSLLRWVYVFGPYPTKPPTVLLSAWRSACWAWRRESTALRWVGSP